MDLYKVKLSNFEGPLDLLLFFVRKDELNIYDIPIARITKSYLEYLKLMQDLNLDVAAEFILMAATLMRIKVKMMLPVDPSADEEEEMMDPREELSRRLIEYRQFKEASKSLSELDEYWRQVYRRSYFNFDLIPKNEEEVYGLRDISFFDLLTAYKKALEKKPIPVYHSVERLNVTVEQQQQFLMDFFGTRSCYLFSELCEHMVKVEVVVTFLALLDLVKRGDIALRQASIFDDIWVYRGAEFPEEIIPEDERALPASSVVGEVVEELTEDPIVPAENTTFEEFTSGDGEAAIVADSDVAVSVTPPVQVASENLHELPVANGTVAQMDEGSSKDEEVSAEDGSSVSGTASLSVSSQEADPTIHFISEDKSALDSPFQPGSSSAVAEPNPSSTDRGADETISEISISGTHLPAEPEEKIPEQLKVRVDIPIVDTLLKEPVELMGTPDDQEDIRMESVLKDPMSDAPSADLSEDNKPPFEPEPKYLRPEDADQREPRPSFFRKIIKKIVSLVRGFFSR